MNRLHNSQHFLKEKLKGYTAVLYVGVGSLYGGYENNHTLQENNVPDGKLR